MSNLYELRENWRQVADMLYEEDVDEQCVLDTLEAIEGEIEDKADNYAMIIKNLLASAEAKEIEAKKMAEKANAEKNRAKLLKQNLYEIMKETGKTKFKTDLFNFSIQKNSGLAPLWVDEDITKIPDEYLKKEPDNAKIRELLKEETVEWAKLEERGEGVRIR